MDKVEEVICIGARECDEEKKKDEKEYDDTEERTAENAIGRGDEHERGNKGEGSRGTDCQGWQSFMVVTWAQNRPRTLRKTFNS